MLNVRCSYFELGQVKFPVVSGNVSYVSLVQKCEVSINVMYQT